MKKNLLVSAALTVICLVTAAQPARAVQLQNMVVVTPSMPREVAFYLDDVFNPRRDSNYAVFLVVTLGMGGMLAAEMSIDPEGELGLEFTDKIEGTLTAVSYSAAETVSFRAGTVIELPINDRFGAALVFAGLFVKDTDHDVDEVPCTIGFSLTPLEEAAEQ